MSLFKSVITVGGFTTISRIFGLVREVLLSYTLGASLVSDAFLVAFKFPNFFRRFFAEGAFNSAFVPQVSRHLANEDKIKGRHQAGVLANQMFSVMAWFLIIFVLVVEIFTPQIMPLLAPGFASTPERLDLAVNFTRITFPYILLVSLACLMGGVLNSLQKFASAAAAPILLNVMMIIALLIYPKINMDAGTVLCVSVIITGILQVIWLNLVCRKYGFKITLQIPRLTKEVIKVLKLMLPGTLGAGVMQINLFIDLILASSLPEGSISYLYYADRLNHLPLSILGVAISTAMLPNLTKYWRQNDISGAHKYQNSALSLATQLSIPSAVGLIALCHPLINTIFGHGNFQSYDVDQTAPALAALALGLPAYVVGKVLVNTFFAREDTKTPGKIAVASVVVNLVLNLILMRFWAHVGMALATSFAACFNTICLAVFLKKRDLLSIYKIVYVNLIKVVTASFLMGGVLWFVQTTNILILFPIVRLGSLVILGGIAYLIFCYLLGMRPIQEIRQGGFKKKYWRP